VRCQNLRKPRWVATVLDCQPLLNKNTFSHVNDRMKNPNLLIPFGGSSNLLKSKIKVKEKGRKNRWKKDQVALYILTIISLHRNRISYRTRSSPTFCRKSPLRLKITKSKACKLLLSSLSILLISSSLKRQIQPECLLFCRTRNSTHRPNRIPCNSFSLCFLFQHISNRFLRIDLWKPIFQDHVASVSNNPI
jgi:hypothetical protein